MNLLLQFLCIHIMVSAGFCASIRQELYQVLLYKSGTQTVLSLGKDTIAYLKVIRTYTIAGYTTSEYTYAIRQLTSRPYQNNTFPGTRSRMNSCHVHITPVSVHVNTTPFQRHRPPTAEIINHFQSTRQPRTNDRWNKWPLMQVNHRRTKNASITENHLTRARTV